MMADGRRREALKATPEQGHEDAAKPVPPFVKPFLWIIVAGRPSTVLALLGAVPAEGWPTGVYLSPGGAEPGGMLRVGIIVVSELPRDRSTILVRIMAGGAALRAALADLAALPADACEREVASMDVLELRRALGSEPNRTVEEEEFIVSTQNIVEEIRDEGRTEGEARALLAVLRGRGIAVPDAARDRILAERDLIRLERWLERSGTSATVADVLDEPS